MNFLTSPHSVRLVLNRVDAQHHTVLIVRGRHRTRSQGCNYVHIQKLQAQIICQRRMPAAGYYICLVLLVLSPSYYQYNRNHSICRCKLNSNSTYLIEIIWVNVQRPIWLPAFNVQLCSEIRHGRSIKSYHKVVKSYLAKHSGIKYRQAQTRHSRQRLDKMEKTM